STARSEFRAARPRTAATGGHGPDGTRPAQRRLSTELPALGTAASATGTALLRLVHAQRPAAEILAVQILNGAGSIGARHLDEREAAGAARVPIGDDADGLHRAVLREQRADLVLAGRKRQIADIDLGHCKELLKETKPARLSSARGRYIANKGREAAETGVIGGRALPPGSTTIRLFSDSEAGRVERRGRRQGKGKVTNRGAPYRNARRRTRRPLGP